MPWFLIAGGVAVLLAGVGVDKAGEGIDDAGTGVLKFAAAGALAVGTILLLKRAGVI